MGAPHVTSAFVAAPSLTLPRLRGRGHHCRSELRQEQEAPETLHFAAANSVGVFPVTCRNACEKAGKLA